MEIKNLYEQFIKIHESKQFDTDYYSMNRDLPICEYDAERFIREYFECGGKAQVVYELLHNVDPMRNMHSISAFFLGVLLKNKLNINLDAKYGNGKTVFPFGYMWYLVCLFHDMGYAQEENYNYKFKYIKQSEKFLKEHKEIVYYIKRKGKSDFADLGIIYEPIYNYSTYYKFSNKNGIKESEMDKKTDLRLGNKIIIEKAKYRKETIYNYLEFCKLNPKINHYDHGIVGGLWLYDSLIKNYIIHFEKEHKVNNEIKYDDFYITKGDRRLHFCEQQRVIFSYLSNCIIAHNMWCANDENNEEYKKCKLNELTLENYKLIKFKDDPILFILALVDTIEPIKLYHNSELSVKEIWKGIKCHISSTRLVYRIDDFKMDFSLIAKKVIDLNKWLDVQVQIDTNKRQIVISWDNEI